MRNFGGERAARALKSEEKVILSEVFEESRRGGNMGNGACSRKQRKIVQSLFLVSVVFGMIYGGMVSYEMHKQLKRTEELALKYQQHQESLSAQLQVVYEHRSRLEKSLQKERIDHKKAKEDFLVYKIESQQSLNKEKQDSSIRFNSLHSQHQILKNQHDDLKKQFYELQERHQLQGDEHNKAVEQHQQRLDQLHQNKESEISKLKDNVLNLREENKQLRKAHQDVYVQLQDTRQQHKNLKSAHDQLVLTLEDHKSALAAAQVQVDEYKQLKETINKIPSVRHPAEPQPPVPVNQDKNTDEHHQPQGAQPEAEKHEELQKPQLREEDGEMGGAEERRRELAEEEMAQAGQPQKLEEEEFEGLHNEVEEEEPEGNQPDENAIEQEQRHAQVVGAGEAGAQPAPLHQVKSALEQQQEQQRLAAHLAEERRQLHLRQEALHRQQLQQQRDREERLRMEKEREEQQNREADLREQQLKQDILRKKAEYENMDADIVQGEDEGPLAGEKEENIHIVEPNQVDSRHIDADIDPEDDPNNQGEDEFEEAEQQHPHEEAEEEELKVAVDNQHKPPAEEQLVMAGNPDQQEDTLDEQYQEEGEDEVQEELPENQKHKAVREEEGDPYNEENVEQEDPRDRALALNQDNQPPPIHNEENYEEEEEEEEEEEGNGGKPPARRGEM
ncbi:hypothetical protein DNTS_014807 [Danionella cerebrum]|uniref:Golgi integral membrane protein 4 n=1 Tax=Danionella cerebrum TaxID=2873325 RepID=A0A553QTU5_9TELE|nr:hypothetical protein DNTS_014807 [Danionella translucida]